MVTIPTSASYFATSDLYLRGNYRIPLRREIVAELLGDVHGKRILDVGCGNGAISLPLSQDNHLVLVDNSAAMLNTARANARAFKPANCTFLQADVGELRLGTFDIVLAIGLLAHVQSIEETVAAISRHLRKGGIAVLQLSPCERLINRLGFVLLRMRGRGYRRMTTGAVTAAAAAVGLVPVTERDHLLVLAGMQRLLGRLLVPYDRFIRRHPALARHGGETILLLRMEKEGDCDDVHTIG